MTGNQVELARYLGVNKSSVSRAARAGRIRPEADGSYDFDKCAAAWRASSGGRADVAARHAAQRGRVVGSTLPSAENAPAGPDSPQSGIDISLGNDTSGRQKAQTARMTYENQQLKLEMALRRGLRFERADVKREAHGLGAMLRAGIERVIDQTAPRLAAAADDLERRRILEKEIRRLRWMLKREAPRSLRRMKDAGAKVGAGGAAE